MASESLGTQTHSPISTSMLMAPVRLSIKPLQSRTYLSTSKMLMAIPSHFCSAFTMQHSISYVATLRRKLFWRIFDLRASLLSHRQIIIPLFLVAIVSCIMVRSQISPTSYVLFAGQFYIVALAEYLFIQAHQNAGENSPSICCDDPRKY